MFLKSIAVAVIAVGIATAWLHQRAKWLASVDFRIEYPDVPISVTSSIRAAEAAYYAERPFLRRFIEGGQDVLTFAMPSLTYRMNFSVGPYHLKAKTIEEVLPWAIENKYLKVVDASSEHVLHSIAYFSEQPALADWGAAVVLDRLRLRHPQMKDLTWEAIAADPMLVAKLYSGYMGAGGAWAQWMENLAPGPEAKRRLGLKGE